MIVIKYFIDKTDKSEYNPGDVYPRDGIEATESRIADLAAKGYIAEEDPDDLVAQLPKDEEPPKPKKAKAKKK